MLFFRRKIQFICPACGIISKLDRDFVRANEEKLCASPAEPAEVECHWCHEGLMVPITYRFRSGQTFRLPDDQLRALRARLNANDF